MFVTIMRTVRTSDLRRGHLRAGFVPWLQIGFFPRSETAGCTIVTIEPPSPDRLSAGPLYMCAPRALGFVPFRVLVFMPYRAMIVFRPTLPRTALFLVPAEVLANHRTKSHRSLSWRHLLVFGPLSNGQVGTSHRRKLPRILRVLIRNRFDLTTLRSSVLNLYSSQITSAETNRGDSVSPDEGGAVCVTSFYKSRFCRSCQGINPHSNILLAMGAATLLSNSARI